MFSRLAVPVALALAAVLLPGLPALAGETTYKMRVTNTTGRQLKFTWYCKDGDKYTKLGSVKFPASAGRTKSFTTSCAVPYVRAQAKIAFDWQKATLQYNDDGGQLPPSNATATSSLASTKGKTWVWNLVQYPNRQKLCLYVEEWGKVVVMPRQCG